MMQAQPSRDRSRSSSSTEAVEVVNPAGIPEPPFLFGVQGPLILSLAGAVFGKLRNRV